MNASIGMRFPILSFTGIIEFVCESGVLAEFAHVTKSGNCSGFGRLSLHFPCDGGWRVSMLMAMPAEYHEPKKLEQIRHAVFLALGIPMTETWRIVVCPSPTLEFESKPNDDVIYFTSSG